MTTPRKLATFQFITFCVCLGLSFLFFSVAKNTVHVQAQDRFNAMVSQGLASMGARADEYGRTLNGVAGFVAASDLVTARDMETYATSVHIADGSYVLDAIGFATLTTSGPGGSNDDFVIRHAAPLDDFDGMVGESFSSNPDLLATALAARDSGRTLSTTPARHGAHWHALLIKPIMRPAVPADNLPEPEDTFVGLAFAMVDVQEIFSDLFPAQNDLIELEVFFSAPDGTVFQPGTESTHADHVPQFKFSRVHEGYGQDMTIQWSSTPAFEAAQPNNAKWVVLALSLTIAALILMIQSVILKRNLTINQTVADKTRELETQHQEKRSILENAMLPIISVRQSGEILHLNDAARQHLMAAGHRKDATGDFVQDLLPEVDIHRADGGAKVVVPPRNGATEPRTLEVEKNTWLTADAETRITLMLRDITDSERRTLKIAETEQRWSLALSSAHIGVFDIDLENGTSVVSDTWRDIMHHPADPACQNPYYDKMQHVHPDDAAVVKKIELACLNGMTDRAEARFRIRVGQDNWRWIKSDAVVVERAKNGRALRMLGIQIDITESNKLEQMKHDFVATVSHELRTPLTSIKGALGLLEAQTQDDPDAGAVRLVQIATANCDRLVALVNDILDMEKINAGSMTVVAKPENLGDIVTLAAEQVEPYASEWKVEINVDTPDPDHHVLTDKNRIMQVLTNLLSNACKFAYPETAVTVTTTPLGDMTKISVTNLGNGISEEFRERIFQPFSQAEASNTRQRGGTGLGLNISRHLVEAMGGEIGFDSVPGEETVFWFTCPSTEGPDVAMVA
ncbi:PAS domain-containing protein [Sulfitobacter sp. M39]|uniref:ATP-binding protein n=1 Tax=Sulfitobacter sp. M39 TaxID=2675334 RepID=UPI001F3ABB70|nr:ATP-binding protein [Sulfitobacter sp. M39]MCF7747011.1 PAS domain-containing protein [Sulfitobacter sp. M39]